MLKHIRFFMTGYLPVGFEFAAEITYPESEGTSSGLLNASAQVFGIIMTSVTRIVFESSGDLLANLGLASILFVGVIMTGILQFLTHHSMKSYTTRKFIYFVSLLFNSPDKGRPEANSRSKIFGFRPYILWKPSPGGSRRLNWK